MNTTTECTVTLVAPESGASETLPVSLQTTTVQELLELATAMLGVSGTNMALYKDGQRLDSHQTLGDCGVQNGDLLAAAAAAATPTNNRSASAPAAATRPSASSGLDFSNLLGGNSMAASSASASASASSAPSGGLDFSNLIQQGQSQSHNQQPVYYQGMTLNDCLDHNTKPEHIITLLQTKDHLFKELNYHQPALAHKLRHQPYDKAVQIWRQEILRGGIQTAVSRANVQRQEMEYKQRLQRNPNDTQAKEYFDKQKRQQVVQEQYFQMMQEYPESMGRVLMLYIAAKVNGHVVQAFVDSGAQVTIMSKRTATQCGLLDMLDERFRGVAAGVGTGTILGRIHIVQLQVGEYHFPTTITVMDDPPPGSEAKEMPFLLGLDMQKRHNCCIDLEQHVLKFRIGPGQYLETPFLHEKDLDASQGGTKGFDADKANQELEEMQRKQEQEEQEQQAEKDKKETSDGDSDVKME